MPNNLSNELIAQLYAQESADPFFCLITVSHDDFAEDIRLVNNMENVTSRGEIYQAFAFKFRLAPDDGEARRDVQIDIDNASLELITELRSVTSPLGVKLEFVLNSDPDTVQMVQDNLRSAGFVYNRSSIKFTLTLDDFLNTKMTSESYDPQNFPGLFA